MKKWFFLDGVGMDRAGIAISHGVELVVDVDTVVAGAHLSRFEGAFVGADSADHPTGCGREINRLPTEFPKAAVAVGCSRKGKQHASGAKGGEFQKFPFCDVSSHNPSPDRQERPLL